MWSLFLFNLQMRLTATMLITWILRSSINRFNEMGILRFPFFFFKQHYFILLYVLLGAYNLIPISIFNPI